MIKFFINRPIFASVIAIIITFVGALSISFLPIEHLPDIAPPQVSVTSTYQGASAEIMADVVTTPLEEQINGVDGMIYMSSVSTNTGNSTITVTFEVGYDIDMATLLVQNRAENAKAQLPDVVQRNAVVVDRVSNNITLVVQLISPNGTYDDVFLSNYAQIHINDPLLRIAGIANITNIGLREYSIRIWLDPNKLASLGITADDVQQAVSAQNVQVAAGSIGAPPVPAGQAFQYQLTALGRLSQISEFEDIIVRTEDNGAIVRVKDVARVELGAEDYSTSAVLNGQPSGALLIFQMAQANTLQIAKEVKQEMEKLAEQFPDDLEYLIPYDTSMFVKASLVEVIHTLVLAIILVFLVVFVFLQTWRATLIPSIAIPVSLIGAFALLLAFGFSINTLSMLGLVLAIGLVVDDAIVVVENVQRRLQTGNENLKTVTLAAMDEVKGPIIATTLVLMAVFVPVAFIPGISGAMYKPFALTVAFSVALSGINSLSLSPALCAIFLKKDTGGRIAFFRWFNRNFKIFVNRYQGLVRKAIDYRSYVIIIFVILIILTIGLISLLPIGFVPEEDQGYLIGVVQLPEAATLERTEAISQQVEKIAQATPGVAYVVAFRGLNFLTNVNQSNVGAIFIVLDPWEQRTKVALQLEAIMDTIREKVATIYGANILIFNAPPIRGLSSTGGFEFELQDVSSLGLEKLADITQAMIAKGAQQPELQDLISTFSIDVPQYYLEIDRTKITTLGLDLTDVFSTLQVYLGSFYVNDFNIYGRTYKVMLQAEGSLRNDPSDITKLYARNKDNQMIPLDTVVTIKPIKGPYTVERYNLYTAAKIQGEPAPGYSFGQAIDAMDRVAAEVLPTGMSYEWTGTVYQEIEAGNIAPIIFILSVIFVFLFLAAQYESWLMPFMILFAVPLAILGAAAALLLRHMALDIYAQIGLVMLIGLSAKNAILIVEFARRRREQGNTIVAAALEAARLRVRPILMTAFAFILGVFPLVIATGAGAASHRTLGTTVFGGMLVATFFSIIIVPVLYVILENLRERLLKPKSNLL